MNAAKGNERNAGYAAPAKELTNIATNSSAADGCNGSFPIRRNTVTAEVLYLLLNGENLTGMDAVFSASTTRLAAFINYLGKKYNWTIDRADVDVGTNDGRMVTIRDYYLPRATIRRAFDSDALEFCRSVKEARAKTRKHAPKAKAEAEKRNAARAACRVNLLQGSLFAGEI